MKPFLRKELLSVIAGTPPQTPWDLASMRGEGNRMFAGVVADLGGVALEVLSIPGGDGQALELRRFTPGNVTSKTGVTEGAIEGKTNLSAVLVSIHGGGYVAGRARFDDVKNAELARVLRSIVLSPDYRLVPEFPVGCAIADCVATLHEAVRVGEEHGVPVFVFGDSAGGGLAFYALERLLTEADGESVEGMILLEPCLDPRCATESMETCADAPVWTARANREAWALAAPDSSFREDLVRTLTDPHVLSGFPRCVIVVNPADPLRDEGLDLARRLAECGVAAEAHMYAGTFHGALSVPGTHTWSEIKTLLRRFMDVSQ